LVFVCVWDFYSSGYGINGSTDGQNKPSHSLIYSLALNAGDR
jgi:hypothetical protein